MKGKLFVLEAVDGAGKTSAVHALIQHLEKQGYDVLHTREPGGTPMAEEIRTLLLSHREEKVTSETEVLLMMAARSQHLERVIKPAIAENKIVLSERSMSSTIAYQSAGRGLNRKTIDMLGSMVLKGFQPDYTFLLDIDPAIGMARAGNRADLDRFEVEKMDFFNKVRESYLEQASNAPGRWGVVDASQSIEAVHRDLLELLDQRLELEAKVDNRLRNYDVNDSSLNR